MFTLNNLDMKSKDISSLIIMNFWYKYALFVPNGITKQRLGFVTSVIRLCLVIQCLMRSVCGIRRGIPLAYYILVRSHAHISIRNHATQVPIRGVLLRPYQESCLEACLNALDSGATRIGVSLPTGSGKTTVFLSLISRLRPSPKHSGADKALIIVNSIELARQSAEQTKKLHPELTVEIEQGIKYKASGTADV